MELKRFRRRVHIAGSISRCQKVASAEAVNKARAFVEELVKELIRRGASFVLPVDDEKTRPDDGLPFCFDWLVWKTLYENRAQRHPEAEEKYVIAVQHHKSKYQIPKEYKHIWEGMAGSDAVDIHSVGDWNMGAKRLKAQASKGDILLLLGGGEGVLHLAELYIDAGKPVIPLDFKIIDKGAGARKLFADVIKSESNSAGLFSTEKRTPHAWIGRLDKGNELQVEDLLELLDNLLPPAAFVIRLLDSKDKNTYDEVKEYHDKVLQPLVEGEYGFKLVTIGKQHSYEESWINQEIFKKLHRSQVVLADLTGLRANCLVELGYAFGRGLPTLLLAKEGVELPFDLKMRRALFWQKSQSVEEKQAEFREHWHSTLNIPPLVPKEDLVP